MSSTRIFLTLMLVCATVPAAWAQFGGGPDITAEVVSSQTGVKPGESVRMAVLVDVPKGWHVNAHEPLEDFLIPTELEMDPPEGFTFAGAAYPEPEDFYLQGSEDLMHVYGGTFAIGFVLEADERLAPGEFAFAATVNYQACNDTQCWAPSSLDVEVPVTVVAADADVGPLNQEVFADIDFGDLEAAAPADGEIQPSPEAPAADADGDWRELAEGFTVVGTNSGYIPPDDFIEWIEAVEAGEASATQGDAFAGMGMWLIILVVLGGGLLLNLTPCVLPLIPVNLAVIGAGAQAKSKSRGFALGLTYGLAIAVVYGLLGILAAVAGVAFGAVNSSPWFNLAVAVIFILLALAMFDVFSIDFSRYQSKVNVQRKEGGSYLIAFFMGGVSALLAGACVGPAVISVVLFAQDLYAQGNVLGLALPLLLGVGMALPWPFAGAGMSFLPKPGGWMEWVKRGLGVLILILALYYGYEGVRLLNQQYFVDEEAVESSAAALDEEGWTKDLAAGLAQARAEGKPVFIDFWATWCKNCLVMNERTFPQENVREALEDYVKVKYQAEQVNQSPAKDVMEFFGVGGLGLPQYVVAQPPTD